MPIVYRCKQCGHVLYVFERAGQDYYGIPTPSELIARKGDRCPRCGRRLSPRPSLEDIVIR